MCPGQWTLFVPSFLCLQQIHRLSQKNHSKAAQIHSLIRVVRVNILQSTVFYVPYDLVKFYSAELMWCYCRPEAFCGEREVFPGEGKNHCPYVCPSKEAIFGKRKFSPWIALFPLELPWWSATTHATSGSHWGYTDPASDFSRVDQHPRRLLVQLHWTPLPWRQHQHADCTAKRELHPTLCHHPSHQHQDHRQLEEHDGAQKGAGHPAQVRSSFS